MMPKELKRDEWGANAVAEAQLRNWNRDVLICGYEGLTTILIHIERIYTTLQKHQLKSRCQ
jgi:hypothetical protein